MLRPFRLRRPIGLDYNMDLDDTFNTKKALRDLGHFRVPKYGLTRYPDQPMIDGIKSFQKLRGLQVDGVMKPDGPTLKSLNQTLAKRQPLRRAQTRSQAPNTNRPLGIFGIAGEIGRKRLNRPQDVLSTRRVLAWAGRLPRHKAKNETRAGNDLFDAVKSFQQAANLKVDGWMRPGGETETELNRVIAPLVKQASTTSGPKGSTDQAGDQQQAAAMAIPAIVYKIAEFFGIAVMAALAWWQAMSAAEREKVRRQVEGEKSDGSDGDDCDHLHYNVDIPVCRAIERKRGKQAAARCYASANVRYAACRRGVPKDQLPPLDTWDN